MILFDILNRGIGLILLIITAPILLLFCILTFLAD